MKRLCARMDHGLATRTSWSLCTSPYQLTARERCPLQVVALRLLRWAGPPRRAVLLQVALELEEPGVLQLLLLLLVVPLQAEEEEEEAAPRPPPPCCWHILGSSFRWIRCLATSCLPTCSSP
jgi:hypothetical protein